MLTLIIFSGCKSIDEQVKKDFLAKNPTYEVVSLGAGEGNEDFVTYHIKYKKPNDENIYEYVVTYQRCDDNEWRTNCKGLNKAK